MTRKDLLDERVDDTIRTFNGCRSRRRSTLAQPSSSTASSTRSPSNARSRAGAVQRGRADHGLAADAARSGRSRRRQMMQRSDDRRCVLRGFASRSTSDQEVASPQAEGPHSRGNNGYGASARHPPHGAGAAPVPGSMRFILEPSKAVLVDGLLPAQLPRPSACWPTACIEASAARRARRRPPPPSSGSPNAWCSAAAVGDGQRIPWPMTYLTHRSNLSGHSTRYWNLTSPSARLGSCLNFPRSPGSGSVELCKAWRRSRYPSTSCSSRRAGHRTAGRRCTP